MRTDVPPNGPTSIGCNIGRSVAIVLATYVRRANRSVVRRVVPFNIRSLQPMAIRWFVWQINKEKSQLLSLGKWMIACGVGMTAFGVFGFGDAAS